MKHKLYQLTYIGSRIVFRIKKWWHFLWHKHSFGSSYYRTTIYGDVGPFKKCKECQHIISEE